MTEEEWRLRPVRDITSIAIEAVSVREGRIRQLETARDYFILMHNAAMNEDNESLSEISAGFDDLKRILPHLLSEGSKPVIMPHIELSLDAAGFPAGNKNPLDFKSIAVESEHMMRLLEGRRKETSSPVNEAMSIAAALAGMSDQLDDVAVHLQTGKDKQAMETIIYLTELLQALMRALSWCPGDGGMEEIIADINTILSELEEALKASDTVLIGDLLEYEIKPRLQELPGRLNFSGEAAS